MARNKLMGAEDVTGTPLDKCPGSGAGRVHSAGRGPTELTTFILAFVSRS